MHLLRLLPLVLVATLLSTPAMSHGIKVLTAVEAGQVKSASTFADGRPVKQGPVKVYDSEKTLLLEGTTDDQGLFAFPIPKVDTLTVEVRDILGHRNSDTIPQAEIAAGMSTQDVR
ncbi:MAG: carboxypeptidase regulatory-like domain-containing protein [Desulfuromonadales bacterium]|nr:carboxypeptidase regulatory-like domain-containing protein [Desulfuromonadales bacterium]